MKKTRRTMQLGDAIRADLANIFREELRDPAFGLVTVTDVEVAPDLRVANIFVSTIAGDETALMKELERSRSKIRYLLGQRVKLRHTPELNFKLDHTAERAVEIERLLQGGKPHGEEDEHDDDAE